MPALFVHLIVTVVRLIKPGGLRAVVAESALTGHQILTLASGSDFDPISCVPHEAAFAKSLGPIHRGPRYSCRRALIAAAILNGRDGESRRPDINTNPIKRVGTNAVIAKRSDFVTVSNFHARSGRTCFAQKGRQPKLAS